LAKLQPKFVGPYCVVEVHSPPHVQCGALWTGLSLEQATPEALPCQPRCGGSGSTPPRAQPLAQPSGTGHPTLRAGNCRLKGGRSGAGRPEGTAGTAAKEGAAPRAATGPRATTLPGGGHPHPPDG